MSGTCGTGETSGTGGTGETGETSGTGEYKERFRKERKFTKEKVLVIKYIC